MGSTSSMGAGSNDVYLVKTDSMGIEQWNHTFGGTNGDAGFAVRQTKDRGYIIVGETSSYTLSGPDVWLIKTNDTGVMEWNRTFGGGGSDYGNTVIQTNDGGYIISGHGSPSRYSQQVWIIKTDQKGVMEWNRSFSGEYGKGIEQTVDGGYVFTGYQDIHKNKRADFILIKTDSYGNIDPIMGYFISENLVKNENTSDIKEFNCTTSIPNKASIQVQFSQDNLTWYNSSGNLNGFDDLNNGYNSINLSLLNWRGNSFYYKMVYTGTSAGPNLPSLKNIILNYEKYNMKGDLISEPYYGVGTMNFLNLTWNSTEPVGTEIKFQLRSAGSNSKLMGKEFIGPDGSKNSYYITPTNLIWPEHDYHRWVQFKCHFSTINTSITPILHNVTLSYHCFPEKPILIKPINEDWFTNNELTFKWEFTDSDSKKQSSFQWQADDNTDFSSIEYDSGTIYSAECCYTPAPSMDDGIWYWRVRVGDKEGGWSLYSDYEILKIDTSIEKPLDISVSPVSWNANKYFFIYWQNPVDHSGISGAFYKLDNPPLSNDDGTYVQGDGKNMLNNIIVDGDGEHTIFIWLKDKAGNVNYMNYGIAKLYSDITAPSPPALSITPDFWTSNNQFYITWSTPSELTGIKPGAYYYMGSHPPISQSNGSWTSEEILSLTNVPEGKRYLYVWLEDLVGNKNHLNHGIVELKYDNSPPLIFHKPELSVYEDKELTVSAGVLDSYSGVEYVKLFYKTGVDDSYIELEMERVEGQFTFKGSIPKISNSAEYFEYYLMAADKSVPSNTIYFGIFGKTDVKPTSATDIDIRIIRHPDPRPSNGTGPVDTPDNKTTNDTDIDKNDTDKPKPILPKVIHNSPIGSSVLVESEIKIKFNNKMDKISTESSFRILPNIAGKFSWVGNQLIFSPKSKLSYSTTYKITILKTAKDVFGNRMEYDYEWTFKTLKDPGSSNNIESNSPDTDEESKTGMQGLLHVVIFALIMGILILIIILIFILKNKKRIGLNKTGAHNEKPDLSSSKNDTNPKNPQSPPKIQILSTITTCPQCNIQLARPDYCPNCGWIKRNF